MDTAQRLSSRLSAIATLLADAASPAVPVSLTAASGAHCISRDNSLFCNRCTSGGCTTAAGHCHYCTAAGQEPALSRTPAPISSLACLVHLLALLPACPFVSFSLLSGLPSDLPELFSPSVYRFRRQDLLLGPPTSFGKFVFLADETFANEKKTLRR